MIYKKPVCLIRIRELIIASKSTDENIKFFFITRYQREEYKRFFEPQSVQGLINTFPPVWNFTPSHYEFIKIKNDKVEIYLCGKIMEKGYLKYHIGEIQIRQAQSA